MTPREAIGIAAADTWRRLAGPITALVLAALAALPGAELIFVWRLQQHPIEPVLPRIDGLRHFAAGATVVAWWCATALPIFIWLWRRRAEAFRPALLLWVAFGLVTLGQECLLPDVAIRNTTEWPWWWTIAFALPIVVWVVVWRGMCRIDWGKVAAARPTAVLTELGQITLALGLALVITAGLWALLPESLSTRAGEFLRLITNETQTWYDERVFPIFASVVPLALAPLLWRLLRRQSWERWHSALALVAVSTLAYLVWDEDAPTTPHASKPAAPPPSQEAANAAHFYAVPAGEPHRRAWQVSGWKMAISERGPWRAMVTAQRDAIRADWAASQDCREWFAQMDAFEQLAADPPRGQPLPVPDIYRRVRELTHLHAAYATLLALDGRGDEAIAMAHLLISVGQKMQVSAPTLVHLMVGLVVQSYGQDLALTILEIGPVGEPPLRQLASRMAQFRRPAELIARVLERELEELVLPELRAAHWSWAPAQTMPVWRRLYYLPHATTHVARTLVSRATAHTRDGRGEELRGLGPTLLSRAFKNPGGTAAATATLPAFDRLLRNAWRHDDERRTLLAEVQAKLNALALSAPLPPKGSQ